jgi:hypothetical protein
MPFGGGPDTSEEQSPVTIDRASHFCPRFLFSINTWASTGAAQIEHAYLRVVSL